MRWWWSRARIAGALGRARTAWLLISTPHRSEMQAAAGVALQNDIPVMLGDADAGLFLQRASLQKSTAKQLGRSPRRAGPLSTAIWHARCPAPSTRRRTWPAPSCFSTARLQSAQPTLRRRRCCWASGLARPLPGRFRAQGARAVRHLCSFAVHT